MEHKGTLSSNQPEYRTIISPLVWKTWDLGWRFLLIGPRNISGHIKTFFSCGNITNPDGLFSILRSEKLAFSQHLRYCKTLSGNRFQVICIYEQPHNPHNPC
ncbi:unnamed protein product [Periconia digitata]|uniref:Uncharacterized protein n=1 Tax=Periconia digitata TaxID=1303443 RepID=A0A9W4XYZ1_9PLEO|nr:unnamed protein product [Periconia digitata]